MLSITGYGLRLSVAENTQLGRMPAGERPAPDAVILAHMAPSRPYNLILIPGEEVASGPFEKTHDNGVWMLRQSEKGVRVILGDDMDSVAPVGTLTEGSTQRGWKIETERYRVEWPESFNVFSTQAGARWPFEMHRADASMIWVQGPFPRASSPAPASLVPDEHTLVEDGMSEKSGPWLESEYTHEGKAWRQSHHYALLDEQSTLVISTQTPVASADAVREAARAMRRTIEPITAS